MQQQSNSKPTQKKCSTDQRFIRKRNTKAELPQEGILFHTQFPSLGIFVYKQERCEPFQDDRELQRVGMRTGCLRENGLPERERVA